MPFRRGDPVPQHIIDKDFADMDRRSGSVFAFLLLYMVSLAIGAGFVYMLFKAGILSC